MKKKKFLLLSALGVAAWIMVMSAPAWSRGAVYGKPMDAASAEVVEFAKLFSNTADYIGKNVIVEARIGVVCPTAGCWITLVDGPNQLLVQFYDFTVKRLSSKTRVRVSGQLRIRNQAPYLAARGLEIL